MPTQRPQLINGEIYHIVIRAIEDLKLFRNEKDYLRMIYDLFVFNNKISTPSSYRNTINKSGSDPDLLLQGKGMRKLLVEILAFCLMPNHVHLLVRQLRDNNSVSKFMQKIGAGYGGYYNQKYRRSGHLFQGRYRIVHIKDDKQLMTVFVYIHTNPVAILVPNWKERGIKGRELEKVIKFLESYKWSSYSDYLGKKSFPSLTSREFLLNTVGGIKEGQRFVDDWLQFKKELADFQQMAIE